MLNFQEPTSSTKKPRGKRGPKAKLEGRFIITEVSAEGKPIAPHENVVKLINHIGALVRDNIPISFRYWKRAEAEAQRENEDEDEHEDHVQQYVVPDTEKNMIWTEVEAHFSFPEGTKLANVRTWALQKGANAFQSYKKRLTADYVKKGLTPDFTKKGNAKLRDH